MPLPVTLIEHSPRADANTSACEVCTTTVSVSPVEVWTVLVGVAPFTMSAFPERSMNDSENWPGGG